MKKVPFLLLYNMWVVTFCLIPHMPLHKNVFTEVPFLYLCDTCFFVPPEGLWVEESLQTGRAAKCHAQVVPVHMATDGHLGGGRSFVAPLNLAMINPLGSPHINMKECHVVRYGNLQGLRNSQEGASCACVPPQPQIPGVLDQHFQILGGWLGYSYSGSPSMSLSRRQGWDKASQRRPYKPSALDPTMASSTIGGLQLPSN